MDYFDPARLALEDLKENFKLKKEFFNIYDIRFTVEHAQWLAQSITEHVKKITVTLKNPPDGYFDYPKIFPILHSMALSQKKLEIFIDDHSRIPKYTLKIKKHFWTKQPTITESYDFESVPECMKYLKAANPRIAELHGQVLDLVKKTGISRPVQNILSATVERSPNTDSIRLVGANIVFEFDERTTIQCGIIAEDPKILAEGINRLPDLTDLSLIGCPWTDHHQDLAFVLAGLNGNTSLRSLELKNVPQNAQLSLYNFMVQNTTLTKLTFETDSTPTEPYLFDFLAHNRTLKTLELPNISPEWDIKKLTKLLDQHPSITSLRIPIYNIEEAGQEACKELLAYLGRQKSIESVTIRVNHVTQQLRDFIDNGTACLTTMNLLLFQACKMGSATWMDLEERVLKYPYLTSCRTFASSLHDKIETNIRNRNQFQEDFVVLLFNIARTAKYAPDNVTLPAELWMEVLTRVKYPGIHQRFELIMADLYQDCSIRRVVKDFYL